MGFDISKIGGGEWFPYQDSHVDPESGEVTWLEPDAEEMACFRQVPPDKFREIQNRHRGKKVNTPVLNSRTKAMEIVTVYEQTAEQEQAERVEFWDNAISDWTFIDPRTKEAIPCTAENKYLLITRVPAFLRWVNRCMSLLSGVSAEADKAAEKN
ncbi:MAG TPA: hypothetical protein VLH56_02445 [Dissulfurispiraceae bacterium]|nr:hypothetical protein [Dissulfurispiraceae bacterium]